MIPHVPWLRYARRPCTFLHGRACGITRRMTEQTAKKIEKLLVRLLAVLEPKTDVKSKGGASVSSLTRNAFTGEVHESDDGGDVPSAMDAEMRKIMRAQDKPGRLRPGRRVDTQPVEERSGRLR